MLPRKFSLLLIFSIILTLGLSISLGSLLAAWTSPTATPPDSNIASPINTSTTGQAKQGGLILNTGGSTNGLIVQSGNVGIGTNDPQAKLEVAGNIIASDPIASNQVATKGYVDASGGGAGLDQYYEAWCTAHQGQKCARSGTMDYKCVGDFCTKAGISNDMDGDGVTGATDCNDSDPTIVAATDGTCDGDADGKIDHTAYTATPKPALADCADSNPSSYICTADGTACTVGTTCSSGFCVDGYCCNSACGSVCQGCNVTGSLGTCTNVPDNTDINSDCATIDYYQYVYGGTSPTCYRYLGVTAKNGLCNGAGACYSVADSCYGQGQAILSCGSTGCWKACAANSPVSSYSSYGTVCYTDATQHGCVGNLVCDGTGSCKLPAGVACTADNQCGQVAGQYLCGVDNDHDLSLTSATTGTCIPGANHSDCNDNCGTCYPGSLTYTSSPDGLDQDCNGAADNETADYCYASTACRTDGGYKDVPSSVAACTARCAAVCSGYTAHYGTGPYAWGTRYTTTCEGYEWYGYMCTSSAYPSSYCDAYGAYQGQTASCGCYNGPYYH